ncbi:Fe-S cluster assembly protein IscX [Pseudoteredinibacter isoporae]|uniref:Fe-S cluster assembly protein IscX n=1 Tax=Pseudoteredinibacter isoporae TaxID=570281 RepID=UPI003107959A
MQDLRWTDVNDIAMELFDAHPDIDPQFVNFVDLRNWVMALEGFNDDPNRCGEKVLEAIQAAWIEEAAD